jgi:taurine dioxygenase
MTPTVTPTGRALGASLYGLDFSQPVSANDAEFIEAALAEHIVVVVKDQKLTPAQYVAAMSALGTPGRQNHSDQLLEDHREIWVIDSRTSRRNEAGEPLMFGSNCWHTDHTNLPQPPKYTALYAISLPPSGGDTRFASGYQLFEHLSPQRRQQIETMRVVYGADRHLPQTKAEAGAFDTPAVHPIVRTHPVTGKRALYVHPLKAQFIEGMAPKASFDLIDACIDEGLDEALTYQHEWSMGDLVIVDNRACMHLAVKNYDPDTARVMHRLIIEGEVPV